MTVMVTVPAVTGVDPEFTRAGLTPAVAAVSTVEGRKRDVVVVIAHALIKVTGLVTDSEVDTSVARTVPAAVAPQGRA